MCCSIYESCSISGSDSVGVDDRGVVAGVSVGIGVDVGSGGGVGVYGYGKRFIRQKNTKQTKRGSIKIKTDQRQANIPF